MFLTENLNKTATNPRQIRLSKLKNKRAHLENLLRSRERLNYEIKNLSKSLAKDQKALLREEKLWQAQDSQKILTESKLLGEEEDPSELEAEAHLFFSSSKAVLDEVLDLLLKFPDTSDEH